MRRHRSGDDCPARGNPHLPFPAPCSPAYPAKPGICPSQVWRTPLPTHRSRWRPPCTWSKLPCPCSSSYPGSRCTSPFRSCPSLPCAISSPTNAPVTFASAHAQTDALASAPPQTLNLYPLFHLPLDVYDMLPLNPVVDHATTRSCICSSGILLPLINLAFHL